MFVFVLSFSCLLSIFPVASIGQTLSGSPTSIAPGGTLTATWSGITNPTTTDWIGLYAPGAANTSFIDWIYVSCSKTAGSAQASGSCPFVLPSSLASGSYELRLLANDGYTRLATSNSFTVGSAPSITSLSPTSGPVGTSVTITGSNFGATQGSSTVTFNGTAATSSSWSATSIVAPVPSGAATGPVVVTVGGVASNGVTFTVTSSSGPSLSVTPTSIAPGGTLTATWSGITNPTTTDWIGLYTPGAANTSYIDWIYVSCSKTAGSAQASGSCPFVLASSLAPGTYELRLLANDGFTRLATSNSFTVGSSTGSPDLGITGLSNPPSTATTGGSFSATDTTANSGDGSAGASTTRYYLSLDAAITSSDPLLSGSRAVSSLAAGASSSGTVTVTIPGNVGAGTYFLGACADDTAAVTESNETNNCLASATTVTVSSTAPTISNLSPTSGAVGTSVTISGSNFGATQGTSTVTFNGTATTPTSWSATSIVTAVPTGATTGPVVVTVGGVASNGVTFTVTTGTTATTPIYVYDELGRLRAVVDPASDAATYNYDAVGNLLSISRQSSSLVSIIEFTPNSSPVGTSVAIFGTGFSTTASQNTVTFNGVAANVTSATATQIATTVPSGATTGPIGVTTPTGSATSAAVFIVVASTGAPTITSFTPTIGTAGTAVTITGTNFETVPARNRVTFNIAGTWPSVVTTNSLTASVPSKATSGHISLTTPSAKATSTSDFFVPPSPYTAADVEFTGRVAFGVSKTITINTPNKIALLVFDGTAGQQVTVNVGSVTFPRANFVSIQNPDGTTLESGRVDPSGATIGPRILPVAGTYTLLVGPYPISTVAGNGTAGFSGDNGPATSAQLRNPNGRLSVDGQGNMLIADTHNNRLRKVSTAGIITTVAGNGTEGYGGDGSLATSASFYWPMGVAVDSQGNLFTADFFNHRVRKVDANGIVTTVAGSGSTGPFGGGYNGDNILATSALLKNPVGVAVDAQGNLFIAESQNHRIRKVDTTGIITTVAGTGTVGYNGDNIPASSANLWFPGDVVVDGQGNLFIADNSNHRVRKVDTTGIITTVAGTGPGGSSGGGYNGDNIPATSALLKSPGSVALDGQGNLFVADVGNNRIRKVNTNGIITTVAGTGIKGYSGDGGPAIMAQLDFPRGVAVDTHGNLYITDHQNNRVRKVDAPSSGSMTLTLTAP